MRLPASLNAEPEATGWVSRWVAMVVKVVYCAIGAIVLLYALILILWPV